jgi:predicted phosphoribosyltransferase
MRFKNRTDAGERLAELLLHLRGRDGVVYGLPRGGVPVAAIVARELGIPLDLITARKVGHPLSAEYAIAAVTDTGELASNPREVAAVDPRWFEREVEAQRREAERRHERYLGKRPAVAVAGKLAILVDDGLATGLTMEAAIMKARQLKPQHLVLAVPVAPPDTAERLGEMVDEVVAIDIPSRFMGAVGAYYEDFHQVTDEEVIALLAESDAARKN